MPHGVDRYMVSDTKRILIYSFAAFAVVISPVWGVRYFVNHDGSSHLYAAHVIHELIVGNSFFENVFTLNTLAVPNSSGHWLIAALVSVLSPVLVTKVMMTLTLGAVVASIMWLRRSVEGGSEPLLTVLLAFSIGTNWLWIQGTYNYILATALSAFTLGLFYRWREGMTVVRTVALSLLLLLVYESHLVSFVVLAGGLFFCSLFARPESRFRDVVSVFVALLPVLPLLFIYRRLGQGAGPFEPVWRALSEGWTPEALIVQVLRADPWAFISRRSIPFLSENSVWFALLSPIVWIVIAIALLGVASLVQYRPDRVRVKAVLPFIALTLGCLLAGILGPDDFGPSNGAVLRERFLIFALISFSCIFYLRLSWVRALTAGLLCFVILFQTAALWEYALRTDWTASQFFAARDAVTNNSSMASVIILDDCLRFHSSPETQIDNYIAVGRNIIVWDNYEFGHYMFPVKTTDPDDRRFVFDLTSSTR
jgi:hypothetical protein